MAFSFKPHRHLNVKKGLIDFLIGPRPKQSSPLCTGWGGERSQGEDDEWWSRVPGHIVITINQHQHLTLTLWQWDHFNFIDKVLLDSEMKQFSNGHSSLQDLVTRLSDIMRYFFYIIHTYIFKTKPDTKLSNIITDWELILIWNLWFILFVWWSSQCVQ